MKKIILALSLVASTCWAKPQPNPPSVLLYNNVSRHTLIAQNEDQIRPLASITKLMTAIVALETGYGLDRKVELNKRWGGVLLAKKSYTRRELFTAMLVKSDNSAAETLAGDYPGGREEFLHAMNERARDLGMWHTHFDDASGLSATNVTTAEELKILLREALKWDVIRDLTTTKKTEIVIPADKRKNKDVKVAVNNTNSPLLGEFDSTILGKTGLTSKAGWCVAMVLEEQGQQFFIIVLGAKTKAERTKLVESTVYRNLR
jgi:D-alanyl-D-alanine endopeptidase (penicillin-binding protein 7)